MAFQKIPNGHGASEQRLYLCMPRGPNAKQALEVRVAAAYQNRLHPGAATLPLRTQVGFGYELHQGGVAQPHESPRVRSPRLAAVSPQFRKKNPEDFRCAPNRSRWSRFANAIRALASRDCSQPAPAVSNHG